mgnify:CR=1 FL=1
MTIKAEYNNELDILHVYSSEIEKGVKGCISFGYATLDISYDNKIIGLEIEEASRILNVSQNVLSGLEETNLIIRKEGNMLLVGIFLAKGEIKTNFQFNFPSQNMQVIAH